MSTLLISLLRQPSDIKHNVTTLPLGIAQVAASLIEEKIECRGLDLPFFAHKYSISKAVEVLKEQVEKYKPQCVGVSIYALDKLTKSYIRKIRKITDAPLIVGGQGPTTFPEVFLNETPCDLIIVGEGEETSKKVWKLLEKSSYDVNNCIEDLLKINGVGIKYKGKNHFTLGERVLNLDKLPFAKRELFPSIEVSPSEYTHQTISGSRSCKHFCSYCGIKNFYMKTKNPATVIASNKRILSEIEHMLYDIHLNNSEINFADEDFFISEEYFDQRMNLLEDISQYDIKLIRIQTRIDNFYKIKKNYPEILERLKKIRLPLRISIGLEHTQDRILNLYNRGYNKRILRDGLLVFNGIITTNKNFSWNYYFIPFHPSLTFVEIKKFIEDVIKINKIMPPDQENLMEILCRPVYPIDGTPFFKWLQKVKNLSKTTENLTFLDYPWNRYTYEFKDKKVGLAYYAYYLLNLNVKPTNMDDNKWKIFNQKILPYYQKILDIISKTKYHLPHFKPNDKNSLKKASKYLNKLEKLQEAKNFKVDRGPVLSKIINSKVSVSVDEYGDLIEVQHQR